MGIFDKKPAAKLSYEQFRAGYKERLGSKKFDMSELNKLWNEYRGVNDAVKKVVGKRGRPKGFSPKPKVLDTAASLKPAEAQADKSALKPQPQVNAAFQVGAQTTEPVAKVEQPAPKPIGAPQGKPLISGVIPSQGGALQTSGVTAEQAQAQAQQALDMYAEVAEAVHQTAANMIKLFTENAVIVEKEKLARLNKTGAILLKKYDTDGQLLEYCPELAYCFTLADIATQTYVMYKRKNPAAEKAAEPEPAQVTQVALPNAGQ